MKAAATLVILTLGLLGYVEPHGHMSQPLSRTSLWQSGEFPNQPPYYDVTGVYCGEARQDDNVSTCGRCGEPPGGKDFSQGGALGNNLIPAASRFASGSTIEVVAGEGAWHAGHYYLELCSAETETDNCFQMLEIVGGDHEVRSKDKICVDEGGAGIVKAQVKLPDGVKCARCTLRWTYKTNYAGQPWYSEWEPCEKRLGEVMQVFRNCADIEIY